MNVLGVLGGGLVVVLSLWAADHSAQVAKLATSQSAALGAALERSEASNTALNRALLNREALLVVLGQIDTRTRSINTVLDGQAVQLNRSLAELKRTDEKTNAYLAGLIPSALGMRYARPDTTDPAVYRAGAVVVQPGAVPTARPSGTGE